MVAHKHHILLGGCANTSQATLDTRVASLIQEVSLEDTLVFLEIRLLNMILNRSEVGVIIGA